VIQVVLSIFMKSGGLEIRDVLRKLKFLVHLTVIKVLSKRSAILTVHKMISQDQFQSRFQISDDIFRLWVPIK